MQARPLEKSIAVARGDAHLEGAAVAVDQHGFGMNLRFGLVGALLLCAADRCLRVAQDVGGVALLIDAKNDLAARWYESYGALAMENAPLKLVLPLAVAADALKRGI